MAITDLSTIQPDADGAANRRASSSAALDRAVAMLKKREPSDAASPPGGSDDGAPPKTKAPPRPTREQHNARIAREKERIAERHAELEAKSARIAHDSQHQRRIMSAAGEMERLYREAPGKFVERLTGKQGALRDVFERMVKEENETPAERKAKEAKRELEKLQKKADAIESHARGSRTIAAVTHEVQSYMHKSDVLRDADRTKLTRVTLELLAENAHHKLTVPQVLAAIEERVKAEIGETKPAPKPAAKPVAKPSPKVASSFLKKDDAAPKAKKPTSEVSKFLQAFRKYQKGTR